MPLSAPDIHDPADYGSRGRNRIASSYFQRTASLSGNVLPATPVSAELPRNIGQSGPVAGGRVGRDAGSVVGRVSLC